MTEGPHILVVEDEAIIRSSLRRLLERNNYRVSEAGSVKEAIECELDSFDVILSDLRLPGGAGTELIAATSRPVLIMTSYSSISSAIEAMKLGAVDYITKPFEHSQLIESVGKVILEHGRKPSEEAEEEDSFEPPVHGMIGSCPQMMELFRRIRKVALTDSTVLINGESGTGKELVARALHKLSSRCDKEMISVNCAAIPENLIESELFGHEKGAFTGATATRTGLVEAAHESTLFLDEIGELPLEAQARLLRVLQENEIRKVGSVQSTKVDVRLVVATHRDLKQLVADGLFREDLYYRINVMTLLIPPLRERGPDIVELAHAILLRTCKRLKSPVLTFDDEALDTIAKYPWPGNVRELENAVERAVVLAEDKVIGKDLLAIESQPSRVTAASTGAEEPAAAQMEDLSLEDYFQRFVVEHEDTMNETQLAKKLGISRKCLWERRQRFGIPRKKKQDAQQA
jgi:DNA-binding NtrC family response regulator